MLPEPFHLGETAVSESQHRGGKLKLEYSHNIGCLVNHGFLF